MLVIIISSITSFISIPMTIPSSSQLDCDDVNNDDYHCEFHFQLHSDDNPRFLTTGATSSSSWTCSQAARSLIIIIIVTIIIIIIIIVITTTIVLVIIIITIVIKMATFRFHD